MQMTGHTEKGADYYDDIFSRDYNEETRAFLYNKVLDKIVSIENSNVLEIGCGTGYLARDIIKRGILYRGFDFSQSAIDKACGYSPGGNFKVADAYQRENYLPVDYNTIVCMEVLEHVDDIKLIKNLPPGVHFIATVPDFNDVAHLRLYTEPIRDIKERFAPYMDVTEIVDIPCFNPAQNKNVHIYMFYGVIKEHEFNRDMVAGNVEDAVSLEKSDDSSLVRLNLGCISEVKPGWINVDATPGDDVAHIFDFESCDSKQLPFDDDSIDEIYASGTLARVNNIIPLMQELYRISKADATATMIVPYGSSDNAYEDPTLVRRFFLKSFNYFSQTYLTPGGGIYTADWKPEKIELIVNAARYGNLKSDEIAGTIENSRNVVDFMKVKLKAIKPARKPGQSAPDVPDYRIVMA